YSSLRISNGLPLGWFSDYSPVISKGDDAGRRARAFRVVDHPRHLSFHQRKAALRRAEIDADRLTHKTELKLYRRYRVALQPACEAYVRYWPKADIGYCTAHVCFRG